MGSHVSNGDRLSIAVIEAVAEFEGTRPTDVRPVLYELVDPDALDALFGPTSCGTPQAEGHVAFDYGEHEVTVYSDGRVEIEGVGESAVDAGGD
ncbi:hypothetical protein DMJ13_14495 [halophilic archaeon]|nr:hypothetical protein DMJ13_14495 [halophilic archaeon]